MPQMGGLILWYGTTVLETLRYNYNIIEIIVYKYYHFNKLNRNVHTLSAYLSLSKNGATKITFNLQLKSIKHSDFLFEKEKSYF